MLEYYVRGCIGTPTIDETSILKIPTYLLVGTYKHPRVEKERENHTWASTYRLICLGLTPKPAPGRSSRGEPHSLRPPVAGRGAKGRLRLYRKHKDNITVLLEIRACMSVPHSTTTKLYCLSRGSGPVSGLCVTGELIIPTDVSSTNMPNK